MQKNDYRGPGCLRRWGRTEDGKVYLLEFGEFHNLLECPYTGEEFLTDNVIEMEEYGVRSPIMLSDSLGLAWYSDQVEG